LRHTSPSLSVPRILRRLSATPFLFFFFNDTAPTEIYTLSLHDALPILSRHGCGVCSRTWILSTGLNELSSNGRDRKSTRLNSSHANISYAGFCLKKIGLSVTYAVETRASFVVRQSIRRSGAPPRARSCTVPQSRPVQSDPALNTCFFFLRTAPPPNFPLFPPPPSPPT